MKVLNFPDFMKNYNLKKDSVDEFELRRVHKYPIYPRDSELCSDKGFIIIDNGSMGGSHWTCFHMKDKKSYYFESFGSQPDKFLLNQLPKPIIYHNYKIQDNKSKLCESYCLYFFFLIDLFNYYDAILKLVFE